MSKGDEDKRPATASKVNVAVRVRPFNKREIELNSICVVDMEDNQTILLPPPVVGKAPDKKHTKTFAFDHCFWSMDPSQENKFATQESVFEKLGFDVLTNVFTGYNACIFAYGQTGSGKSYTMMGSHDQPGLIPRLCSELFEQIVTNTNEHQFFKVEVSYMEIYNEKVRDLLDPEGGKRHLKVREHKSLGPYVDGLQQLAVSNASDIQELMSEGNKSRTVAATKMNAESSRSHAVFTLIVTQTLVDPQSQVSGERVSKVSLVDLAGSERASKTGAEGSRLKEGSNINKSLTTLGLVISSLADQASGKSKNKFVPYRDSALTWILKDNLGGNSRTAMVATISPSADNYEETLSTLRYADRAKRIVNKAVVNEDPNARIIRELREEVEKLQNQLKESESMRAPELKEKLEQSENLIKEISQTWEEKLRKTEAVHKQRQETLEKMGLSLEKSGIKVEKTKCFLVNLNADPSLNELLVYYLKPTTTVGQNEESDMQLSGLGILDFHCHVEITNEGGVFITPMKDARTCINGQIINSRTNLRHGDRILWGNNHFFRINIPRIPRLTLTKPENEQKDKEPSDGDKIPPSESDISLNESTIDYEFAQREVLMNQVEAPIQETIMHLENEFKQLTDETNYSTLDIDERNKYEEEIRALRQQLLSLSPRGSSDSLDPPPEIPEDEQRRKSPLNGNSTNNIPLQYKDWKKERNNQLHCGVKKLQEELVRAQAAVQEANYLAKEMNKETEFLVSLQIPAHNLTPNRKRGTLLCVPAIQVIKNGRDCQVWSVEKLENRLADMHDVYEEYKENTNKEETDSSDYDPFIETERNQLLIGVANVFLTCLLQNQPFRYPVPIIDQHGQVAGKLLVEIHRISGSSNQESMTRTTDSDTSDDSILSDVSSSASSGIGSSLCTDVVAGSQTVNQLTIENHNMNTSSSSLFNSSSLSSSVPVELSSSLSNHRYQQMTCRVTVIEAQGLSSTLSHFVQCQYYFLNCPDVILVPPDLSPEELSPKGSRSTLNIKFHHTMQFTCNITEDLIDNINSGSSLAIEVWGHRDRYNNLGSDGDIPTKIQDKVRSSSLLSEKHKSLTERWSEVIKRIKLEIIILELGENAEYVPVEIVNKLDVLSKGVFELKQGQSRRIEVSVETVQNSGTLPLIVDSIASVYAGSVQSGSAKGQSNMDSYHDNDLTNLRNTWLDILEKRKDYLDQEIKRLANKADKSLLEQERESRLFDQWLTLTEERNSLATPHAGIPGAPASWDPPDSIEMHIPVLFLDITGDDCKNELLHKPRGLDNMLPNELPGNYIEVPIIRAGTDEMHNHLTAVASWDSSLHDSILLNRVTPSNEQVYVVIQVHLRLSHPVDMSIVLRKRICVSIYKQRGITAFMRRRMQGKLLRSSGVIYELVSSIPLSSQDNEDQESLAIMAASGVDSNDTTDDKVLDDNNDKSTKTKKNPFESYVTRSMQSVDDILSLDKIRQQVTLREIIHAHKQKQKSQKKSADSR
ncbi:kinesin-like protein KIF13A isoform X1 [Styela clava]